jgi:hypothetical protein
MLQVRYFPGQPTSSRLNRFSAAKSDYYEQ